MSWNPKKSAKKAGGSIAKVTAPAGQVLSQAATSTPIGKALNAGTMGAVGAAGSVLQGKNPLQNTPVGGVLNAAGLGGLAGTLPGGGGGGGGGDSAGPRPDIPELKSALKGSDGTLGDQFRMSAGPAVTAGNVTAGTVTSGQLDTNALKADPRALDAMRERAMSGQSSPWLKMQLEQQGLGELNARDQAAQQALSGASLARSQMAMKGGAGGGARERIAMGAARDMNAARQQIGRAGQQDRLGLNIANDQTNMGLLSSTAGLDLSHAAQQQDMGKFNIGSALDASKFNTGLAFDASKTNAANTLNADQFNSGQTAAANQFNAGQTYNAFNQDNQNKFGIYGEQMKGYAAGKAGDAIAKNGGKK